MKEFKRTSWLLRIALCVSISMVMTYGFNTVVGAQTQNKGPAKKLSGEQLYTINCMRCHTQRYPSERTDAQYKTIMMHMRVRANLPPDVAKKILEYLKENK